jgi:hypothetical protein
MSSALTKKLRLQPDQRVLILNAPEGYVESLGDLPEGVQMIQTAQPGTCDFVHLFIKDSAQYAELGPIAIAAIKYDGILWVSYPKKSSKVETDLSRDMMWGLLADTGLRPVTQISIDKVWSALRFRPTEAVGS